jgi:hypothetical protein
MHFHIEGNVCYAICPPGFDIQFEIRDVFGDGARRYAITVVPVEPIVEKVPSER